MNKQSRISGGSGTNFLSFLQITVLPVKCDRSRLLLLGRGKCGSAVNWTIFSIALRNTLLCQECKSQISQSPDLLKIWGSLSSLPEKIKKSMNRKYQSCSQRFANIVFHSLEIVYARGHSANSTEGRLCNFDFWPPSSITHTVESLFYAEQWMTRLRMLDELTPFRELSYSLSFLSITLNLCKERCKKTHLNYLIWRQNRTFTLLN